MASGLSYSTLNSGRVRLVAGATTRNRTSPPWRPTSLAASPAIPGGLLDPTVLHLALIELNTLICTFPFVLRPCVYQYPEAVLQIAPSPAVARTLR